jgi:YbbR domain-containing protein
MIFKNILKAIFRNWPIKLLCILASASLWFYVTSSQNTIAKFPGSLNIRTANISTNLVAIYDVKTVEVKVMAEPSVWQKLSAESFSASIDLSGVSAGTHEVPVNVTTSIPGVQIIEKTPDKILVTLEPVISKDVSIAKKIEGGSAEGMVPGNITFSPDRVRIKGGQSAIDNISEATAVISLNGEGENFKRNISLIVLNDSGEEMKDVEIWPNEVEADVSIVKGSNVKTVGIKVKIIGSPKENYYVSDVTSMPGAVDISGIRDIVVNTKYLETQSIDISGVSTDIERDIALSAPDGITILGNSSAKVHVIINISSFEISRSFDVSNYKILNSNIQVASFDPTTVKVVCEGLPNILGTLTKDNFSIDLNLIGKTPDPNGEINVAIVPENVHAVDGVTIISVEPNTIKIKSK